MSVRPDDSWGGMVADPAYRDIDTGARASDAAGASQLEEPQNALELEALGESAFTLRGMGDKPASCGSWYPMDFCESCGEPHFRESHCELRDCPDCWRGNVARTTESITARFCGLRHHQEAARDKRAVHAVVSPPDGELQTKEAVYDGFRTAYDLAAEHGIRGGVVIFHGYRPTSETKAAFAEADPDMPIWQWIRENETMWRAQVDWSPHWHVVGLARDVEKADPEADNGWVVWNIRSLASWRMSDPVNGEDAYSDTAGLVRYLLSHASHEREASTAVVRWFGDGATACFSMKDLAVSSKRIIEDKAHQAVYDEPLDPEDADPQPCEEDGCDGELCPIWDAYDALCDLAWCERIGREQVRKLEACADWMMGDLDPPPGMKYPDSAADAREVMEVLRR